MLLTAAQASSTLGVSSCTLRRWHREGKITALRSPSGVRLYDVSNILEPTASSPSPSSTVTSRTLPSPNPTGYIYTRVSSAKQKADLERQKQLLLSKYPKHELVSDVGSGINFKRAGLRSLLERSRRGLVKEVTFFFLFFIDHI
ncbi:MAG TPA: recombinase family protein [Chlamydiales bacterium]|nr:recombinase family protein [Chlamydiales bacterium]